MVRFTFSIFLILCFFTYFSAAQCTDWNHLITGSELIVYGHTTIPDLRTEVLDFKAKLENESQPLPTISFEKNVHGMSWHAFQMNGADPNFKLEVSFVEEIDIDGGQHNPSSNVCSDEKNLMPGSFGGSVNCVPDFNVVETVGIGVAFQENVEGNVSYQWNFDDGKTSSLANPVHNFPMPGVYNVCLSISSVSNACGNTVCKDVEVGEINACNPVIGIPFDEECPLIDGEAAHLCVKNISAFPANVIYNWVVSTPTGESETYNTPNIDILTPAVGVYEICLNAITPWECTGQSCMTYEIIGECSGNFDFTVSENEVTFSPNVDFENNFQTVDLSFDFGDGESATYTIGESISHTYAATGNYEVCVEVSGTNCLFNYCTDVTIDSVPGEANQPTSTANLSEKIPGYFYPNPVQNHLFLQVTALDFTAITIYNLKGAIVYEGPVQNQLKLNFLDSGVYILALSNETQTWTKKFVKE